MMMTVRVFLPHVASIKAPRSLESCTMRLIGADSGLTMAISRDEGVSVLLVEQNSRMALSISNRAYALSTGSIALSGNSKDLMNDDRIKAAYLGGEL